MAPTAKEFASGNMCVPISMKVAIRTIFESVPKPGRSFRGIHKRSTKTLMTKVAKPILIPVL
jgi:hypothetical protein